MPDDNRVMETGPDPSGDTLQTLRYAEELQRVHALELDEREQLEVTQQALARSQAQQLVIVEDLRQAYQAERQRRRELNDAYLSTIRVLAAAVEARDDYTGGHIERVRAYSHVLGVALGFPREALWRLDMGAILHDVGKIGISDTVLTKPGPLDEDEWRQMRQHPAIGANLLGQVPFLSGALPVVSSHHERWDGAGYPQGLKAEAIPMEARIVAVADAFDAMTTDRVYRRGRGIGAAVAEIQRCSGTHFDPTVVEAFLEAWKARAIP